MKYKKFASIAIFASVFCILLLTSPASFAGSGAPGSGSGQNRDVPLTLESSSVSDGQADIPVNETIQLNFNKNICNITVLAANKKCFHLTDEAGSPVAIRLLFPDDQVQRKYRRQAFIQPVSELDENARYKITVDRTLTAKNGTPIDNAYIITFTTGSGKANRENAVLKELGSSIVAYETAYSETPDSVPVNRSGLDAPAEEKAMDTGATAKIGACVLLLVVILFTIFLMKRRTK
ncbi:MAG: hypothetical protein HFE76_04855 [Firmicutes bacterium]|nr:hypothetical protein [Bacillota bacterium]